MRNNIVVIFLLSFVFLFALLHQWVGWKTESHEIKIESLELFDKSKCLRQLNVNVKKKTSVPDTQCHQLFLMADQAKTFNFCIPLDSKYLVVEKGIKCATRGFWIHDRKGCTKGFAPIADERILKRFMRRIGFAKFMLFFLLSSVGSFGPRLVFFADSCVLDKKGMHKALKCAINPKGDVKKYEYRISLNLISYPLSAVYSGC